MLQSTLYKVLCTTIDTLYGQNLACSFQANAVDTVALVYKIEHQLSEWQRSLPSHMRLIATQDILPEHLPPAESSTENAWRQLRLRFILTLRYTNVRILTHRPVLVKFLEGLSNPPVDNQETSLLQQMGAIHIQITIKSAKEIICLVLNALQSATGRSKWGLLGAWWFTLYYSAYLFSCLSRLWLSFFRITLTCGAQHSMRPSCSALASSSRSTRKPPATTLACPCPTRPRK
jgi:hypothetical protein